MIIKVSKQLANEIWEDRIGTNKWGKDFAGGIIYKDDYLNYKYMRKAEDASGEYLYGWCIISKCPEIEKKDLFVENNNLEIAHVYNGKKVIAEEFIIDNITYYVEYIIEKEQYGIFRKLDKKRVDFYLYWFVVYNTCIFLTNGLY